jgi:hypothetical protein
MTELYYPSFFYSLAGLEDSRRTIDNISAVEIRLYPYSRLRYRAALFVGHLSICTLNLT